MQMRDYKRQTTVIKNKRNDQDVLRELRRKIYDVIVVKKKYRDRSYTVVRLTEELHTTRRRVSDVISTTFGMTYRGFVNSFRVLEAQKLLADDRYSVEDISAMVGFGSRNVFCRAFGRVTGMTPRDYRKRARSEKKGKSA